MKTLNKSLKRGQGWVKLCAQSALCLRSFKWLLAKCSFARVKARLKQPFWATRLAFGKEALCIGKALLGHALRKPFDPLLTKPSSLWKVSWFVSTQDSKIVDNFAPSHFFASTSLAKSGGFSARQSELQRKEIKEIYANI